MLLPLAVVTMGLLGPSAIAQNIFNCSSFASSGSCGYGSGQNFYNASQAGGLAGSAINLTPSGSNHNSYNVQYKTRVNIQAFTTTFTFVPNGYNLAFVIQNCNIGTTCNGPGGVFAAGAGGEGGFTQFEPSPNQWPNNLFALMLDQFSAETNTGSFDYSTAQIYQTLQAPYLPISCGSSCVPIYSTNKISTSPVPLNSPANTQGTTTRDTYSATITYNGEIVTFNLYDVTAGGSCPGATCFTHSWPVFIPSIVKGTTANIGFANGVGESPATNLTINSWSYTVNTPGPLPTSTVTYSNSVANPTFSPAPGSYTGTQDVTISTTTPNAYICYTLAATPPTFLPQPDNNGGCNEGTLYSSPVSVSSTQTLYAMAGSSIKNYPSGAENPTGLGPPSSIVTGTYAIGTSGTAATPTFSPVPGTYSSPQTVTISDSTSGATIYYTTNGSTPTTASTRYTDPVTITGSETMKAIAIASGDASSGVGSATYTMSSESAASTPTFSPVAGTYTVAQLVTLSDPTSGATFYYTTDGSTPTTSSTKYTGPITVSSTEALKAIAVASDFTSSGVASASYTIGSSSGSGSANADTVIDYPNGFPGSPNTIEQVGSAFYSGSTIQLTSLAGNEVSNAYFKTPVNVQAFSTAFTWTAECPSGGILCGDGMGFVIISPTNPNSPNYWSGGSGAQLGWSSSSCTGSGRGCDHINSVLVKFNLYNVATGVGHANLTGLYSGGEYPQPPNTEYDMAPSGINIQSGHLMRATLTYNGTTLDETVTDTVTNATYSNSYAVNIPSQVGGDSALVGFSGGSGAAYVQQNIESWTYTVQTPGTSTAVTSSSTPVVSTPTFSPAVGTYSSAQSVTLSDATAGATIYYTTNGTTPTTSSTKYAGPITVSSTETLEAIAVASGDANSKAASAVYTITPTSAEAETVINFPNGFSNSPGTIEPIDDAFYTGSSIQLTSLKEYEAGNVYFKTAVNVQAFSTTFTWTAQCPGGGIHCGDGMGFVIIGTTNPKSPSYWSGGTGSQLSWSDDCTASGADCDHINSVLVKFGLYNLTTGSYAANLTGLYSGGEWPQPPNPEYDMGPSGINMQSGHLMRATLSYNGTTLYETVTDTVTNNSYTNHYTANIPSLVGGDTAIVGFAGATGTSYVQQNIESWTYTVQ